MKTRKFRCIIGLGIAVIGVALINIFLISVFRVSGVSMEPTLKDGSYVIVRKNVELQRGNLVLAYDQMGGCIVKRVVGLGGDYIQITSNSVHVNGELFDCRKNHKNSEFIMEIYVPENAVFLLGDNRTESTDSRMFGSIDISQIIGVALIKEKKSAA